MVEKTKRLAEEEARIKAETLAKEEEARRMAEQDAWQELTDAQQQEQEQEQEQEPPPTMVKAQQQSKLHSQEVAKRQARIEEQRQREKYTKITKEKTYLEDHLYPKSSKEEDKSLNDDDETKLLHAQEIARRQARIRVQRQMERRYEQVLLEKNALEKELYSTTTMKDENGKQEEEQEQEQEESSFMKMYKVETDEMGNLYLKSYDYRVIPTREKEEEIRSNVSSLLDLELI